MWARLKPCAVTLKQNRSNMFFKNQLLKPIPKPVPKWGIYVNGRGEYSVKYHAKDLDCPDSLQPANMYFKKKVFANEMQAANAIHEWKNNKELEKKTLVKYL